MKFPKDAQVIIGAMFLTSSVLSNPFIGLYWTACIAFAAIRAPIFGGEI
jgi:hypothetical protein